MFQKGSQWAASSPAQIGMRPVEWVEWGRGDEGIKIYRTRNDREGFVVRLADLCRVVYAEFLRISILAVNRLGVCQKVCQNLADM